MHIKGHRIETNFALYFTPFDVTFAKGSPLLTSVFPGMSEKMGFWQGIRGAGRGAGASTAKLCEACGGDQSGKKHNTRPFLLT
jgi:hypothetical protein